MDSPVKQKKASHYIANKKLHIIAITIIAINNNNNNNNINNNN